MNGVKKNSPHFTAFSNKNSPHLYFNIYWIWFKFWINIKEVLDRWRSWIRSWRHAGGEKFEPVNGSFFFCKSSAECGEKKTIHRNFTAFCAKRCKKYAVKFIYFHRISPHFLQKFTSKPRPGYLHRIICFWKQSIWLMSCQAEVAEVNYHWSDRARQKPPLIRPKCANYIFLGLKHAII